MVRRLFCDTWTLGQQPEKYFLEVPTIAASENSWRAPEITCATCWPAIWNALTAAAGVHRSGIQIGSEGEGNPGSGSCVLGLSGWCHRGLYAGRGVRFVAQEDPALIVGNARNSSLSWRELSGRLLTTSELEAIPETRLLLRTVQLQETLQGDRISWNLPHPRSLQERQAYR